MAAVEAGVEGPASAEAVATAEEAVGPASAAAVATVEEAAAEVGGAAVATAEVGAAAATAARAVAGVGGPRLRLLLRLCRTDLAVGAFRPTGTGS